MDARAHSGREGPSLAWSLVPDLAHDLKVPVSVVLALTSRLLESETLLPAQRRDVASIATNAQLLTKLVQDLLEAARLEGGAVQLQRADCDLVRVVRMVASRFEGVAAERAQRVVVDAPERLPAVADEGKLRTVLRNLIANALRFAPRGGVVRCTLTSDGDRVRIEVADNGPGIPPPQRSAALERFRRVASGESDDPVYGGSGLGLAIANELVAKHGGALTLDEAPEGGALAVIDLPHVRPAQGGDLARDMDAAHRAEPERPVIARLREDLAAADRLARQPAAGAGDERPVLLLAERNAQLGSYLEQLLSPAFAVIAAGDGEAAIDVAQRHRCDIVLASAGLRHDDARALVSALRARRAYDWVPIVVMTVTDDDGERAELLHSGCQDVVSMPFGAGELLARLHGQIARRGAALTIREGAERFRVAFDQAPIGMALVAPDGRYLKANFALCEMLGYTQDELLRKTYLEITHPDDRERSAEEAELLLADRIGAYHLAKRLMRADGEAVDAVVSATLVRDDRDRPRYFISQVQLDRRPQHPPDEHG